MLFDDIKTEFPTLKNNPELAYFDSAASTQTHQSVLDRMNRYYEHERCNIHRGDFHISQKVTQDCETARQQVAELINASSEQIVFTSGATEGLNTVAHWHRHTPVVIISETEHTANILPWITQGRTVENNRLAVLPINDNGYIDFEQAKKLFEKNKYSLLSVVSTSNVTGVTQNITKLIGLAHEYGIRVCLDACQTLSSHSIDVKLCEADYLVASGHKMFGPTGIGFLYVKADVNKLEPLKHGGGTVSTYNFSGNVKFYDGPIYHEPGTPNIAGVLGLGVAAEWINFVGYDNIALRIRQVDEWLEDAGLFDIKHLQLSHAVQNDYQNVYSFIAKGFHPADISAFVGLEDVAVRVGKVCAHPIVNKISHNKGIFRVSTHVYNDKQDCEKLVEAIWKAIKKISW